MSRWDNVGIIHVIFWIRIQSRKRNDYSDIKMSCWDNASGTEVQLSVSPRN
jgi:hypothetical protein